VFSHAQPPQWPVLSPPSSLLVACMRPSSEGRDSGISGRGTAASGAELYIRRGPLLCIGLAMKIGAVGARAVAAAAHRVREHEVVDACSRHAARKEVTKCWRFASAV